MQSGTTHVRHSCCIQGTVDGEGTVDEWESLQTTVECQTGESMIVPPPPKKEGILARLFTRKVASPCKGIEKKEKRYGSLSRRGGGRRVAERTY